MILFWYVINIVLIGIGLYDMLVRRGQDLEGAFAVLLFILLLLPGFGGLIFAVMYVATTYDNKVVVSSSWVRSLFKKGDKQ